MIHALLYLLSRLLLHRVCSLSTIMILVLSYKLILSLLGLIGEYTYSLIVRVSWVFSLDLDLLASVLGLLPWNSYLKVRMNLDHGCLPMYRVCLDS